MIEVQSIEVVNIRSLGHATFRPLASEQGATAIAGATGAGKSSFLTALMWALFNVVPRDTKLGDLRRQGTEPGADPCHVKVTFTHDNQTITVERGFKGRRDSTYAVVTVDGIETTLGKSRSAESWVKQRLDLDAQGFLTAFVVRQKEMDSLVRAKPAERRALIESLAGITRMNDAVKAARAEERHTQMRLDVMPGSEEDVAAASAAVQRIEPTVATATATLERAATDLRTATEHLEGVRAEQSTLASRVAAAREHASHVAAADQAVAVAERDLEHATTTLEQVRVAAAPFDPDTLAALRARLDDITAAGHAASQAVTNAERLSADAANAETEALRTRSLVQTAEQAHAAAQTHAEQLRRDLASAPGSLDADLAAAQAAQQQTSDRVAVLTADVARLDRSIAALRTATDAACPTCRATLTDPNDLITEFQSDRERVASEEAEARRQAQAAVERTTGLTRQVEHRNQLTAALQTATATEQARLEALNQARANHDGAARRARTVQQEATRARDAVASAAQQVADLQQQYKTTAADVRAQEAASTAADQLDPRRQAVRLAQDTVARAAAARAALATDALDGPTTEQLAAARDRVMEATAVEQGAREAHHDAQEAVNVATFQLQTAQNKLQDEQRRLAERADVAAELEGKTATTHALDRFRRDRVARLTPELSEIATDFIVQMTDGKYTAVDLDDTFTPLVTDDQGHRRPAHALSGGEESAVALALRIAIGELITGSRGGLLFLDEVLTAQDAQRRPAMMRAIGALPHRQVITISHTAEATDMVDAVWEVHAGDDGATITQVGDQASRASLDEVAA